MRRHPWFLVLVVAACGDRYGSGTSGLGDQTILKCTNLVMVTGHYGSGQSPSTLAIKDQSGTQDTWSAYLEFTAPVTAECTFALPPGTSTSSISELFARVNYRGPAKAEQLAIFEIYDPTTSSWVELGDNGFAADWAWSASDMHASGDVRRLFGNGSTVRARYRVNASVDASQLDQWIMVATSSTSTSTSPDAGIDAAAMTPADSSTATGISLPPSGKIKWDWQIGASSDAAVVPPSGAVLIDVDMFNTSAAKVGQLDAAGLYTVCYINAGSWQPGYPDSDQYPSYLKIQQDPDWPEEWFLDVTDVFKPGSVLASILRNRLALCKQKGFKAVEPDNLQNDENVSGGLITTQEQIDFNGWFADAAHEAGLAVFQKNGPDKILLVDRTGKKMVDKFDGILNEQCQQYNECSPLSEYVRRGKLALNVEYQGTLDCSLSNSLNINSLKKGLSLVGATDTGYRYQNCP